MTGPAQRVAELAPAPAADWAGMYTLPRSPHSSALARLLLRQALADCPPETIQAAELLVSELVTNAIRYAETALALHIEPLESGFRIVVEDDSADSAVLNPAVLNPAVTNPAVTNLTLSGAGGTGKRVWFELNGNPAR
jgi:hypothetical protein